MTISCHIKCSKKLSEDEKMLLKNFLIFCKKKLEINQMPVSIEILKSRGQEGVTTGGYNPNTHEVIVYGGQRLLLDVFRTLAHELVHHKQNERGNLHELLQEYPEDLYSPYENEAYEKSGNFIKEWTRKIKKENMLDGKDIYEFYF